MNRFSGFVAVGHRLAILLVHHACFVIDDGRGPFALADVRTQLMRLPEGQPLIRGIAPAVGFHAEQHMC